MRSILFTGALACGVACAQTSPEPADGWTVYADIAAWQASDAVPISQLTGDWHAYAPRKGRNTFLMRSKATAGFERNRWRIGLELRQDAFATTDRASLDAYKLFQQEQEPLPPARFTLQGRYFSWQARGLRVGYRFDGPRIAGRPVLIELDGAVYGRQRLRERSIEGTLSFPQTGTYAAIAAHRDADNRMVYPFMGNVPSASGAGLSLAATVPLAQAWSLGLRADDLASRLRWAGLPVSTESLDTDAVRFDQRGYASYRPLLSGRKRQQDLTFRIPRYTAVALDYHYRDWRAGVQLARYASETIPALSLSRQVGWLTLHANIETRFDSAGIGLDAGNLRIMLRSDSFRLDQAKARALNLQYHRAF